MIATLHRPMRLRRTDAQTLARVGLVVAPRRSARQLALQGLLPAAALLAGAGAGWLGHDRLAPVAPPADATAEVRRLQQQVDEARSALRLSGAHGQELERQVDALNQQLRDTTVELTFVKKARAGR